MQRAVKCSEVSFDELLDWLIPLIEELFEAQKSAKLSLNFYVQHDNVIEQKNYERADNELVIRT